MPMNTTSLLQATGTTSVAVAGYLLLVPLPRVLAEYSSLGVQDDRWAKPALLVVIPLWVLLTVALLCVNALHGIPWLRIGAPAIHAITLAAGVALAAVTFASIGLYIRPGFTPRGIYSPFVYGVPAVTALVVLVSLSPRITSVLPVDWLRKPWALFTGLSIVISVGVLAPRALNLGLRTVADFVHRLSMARDRSPEQTSTIAGLDPQDAASFDELLRMTDRHHSREVRAAATSRLQALPDFATRLAQRLESSDSNAAALAYIESATLAPNEQALFARSTHAALQRFIRDIPAPNHMPHERRKELLRWGREALPTIIAKFADADVDFSEIMPTFEAAVGPMNAR